MPFVVQELDAQPPFVVQQFDALLPAVLFLEAVQLTGDDEYSRTQTTIENCCDKEIGVEKSKGLVHWSKVCQLQQCISNLSLVNILSKTKTHTICNVLVKNIIIISISPYALFMANRASFIHF